MYKGVLGVAEAGGLEAVPVGDIKFKPVKSVDFKGGMRTMRWGFATAA